MAFRTPTTAATTASGQSSVTVNKPTGTVENDIVILAVTIDAAAATSVVSTGFTALESNYTISGPDGHTTALLWKRAGASEPSTYTASWSSATTDSAAIACFAVSGRSLTSSPVHTAAVNTSSNSSPVTITATGVTAVAGDDLLWIALPDQNAAGIGASFTAPSGYTEIVDVVDQGYTAWCGIGAAKLENASAGATGNIAGTFTLDSGAAGWAAFLVRIPATGDEPSGIQFVGGTGAGRAGSTSTASQSLTALSGGIASAPAEGDLVLVVVATASQGRNPTCAVSGWSTIGTQLNEASQTYDTSLQVSYKFMGSTPDTSVTIPSTGNVADGQSRRVLVFRGVDPTTPFDVSAVSATGTGTTRFDAPAITPTTAGAFIVVFGGGAAAASTTALGTPSGLSGWGAYNGADTNDGSAGGGYYDGWTSGSYDPAAPTTGGSVNAVNSWAAWTIALRPATTLIERTTGLAEETDDVPNQYLFATRASETDTAYSLAKAKPVGLAEETDSALAPTVSNVYDPGFYLPRMFYWGSKEPTVLSTGTADETDASFSLGRIKFYATSLASETDASFALARIKSRAVQFASETDTSYSLGRVKFRTVQFGTSTNTALAVTRTKIKAIGLATETDSAVALELVTTLSIGLASETDSSLALGRIKSKVAGRSDETDSSLALARVKIKTYGFASETDSAYALSQAYTGSIGLSIEYDLAYALARLKTKTYSFATSTNTAFALAKVIVRGTGLATSVNAAFSITYRKIRATGLATSANTAYNLGRIEVVSAKIANETDSSLALSRVKTKSYGFAESTNTALAPFVFLASANPGFRLPLFFHIGEEVAVEITTGLATESDSAYALTALRFRSVGLATEVDAAFQLGYGGPGWIFPFGYSWGVPGGIQSLLTGLASETDTAFSIVLRRNPTIFMVRWAQETPVAYTISRVKAKTYLPSTSTDVALAPSVARVYNYGLATEVDTAIARTAGLVLSYGIAFETDTAFLLNYRKAVTTKIAESANEALAMIAPDFINVGVAEEVDEAFALVLLNNWNISAAVEVDTAYSLSISHLRFVDAANESDYAIGLPRAKIVRTGIAQTFDLSLALARIRRINTGYASSTNTAIGRLVYSMMAREHDVANFLVLKRNGTQVYPQIPPDTQRRMWERFVA